jgi:hypothetical protein
LLRSHVELFGLDFVNPLGNLVHVVLPSNEHGLDEPLRRLLGTGPASRRQCDVSNIANLFRPGLLPMSLRFAIGHGIDWQVHGEPFLIAALLIVFVGILAWRVTQT